MNLTLFLVFVGLLIFLGLFSAGYALFARRVQIAERIRTAGAPDSKQPWLERIQESLERLVRPLGEMVPRSPEDLSKEARRLVAAGFRRRDAVLLFYGARVAMAGGLYFLFSFLGLPGINFLLFLIAPIFLAALLPDLWLKYWISRRQKKIQVALPDMMDLTVVCVEAGMGLDSSLLKIGREIRRSHPDLSDELHLYNLEVNAGKTRAEAFRNMAERTQVEDLRSLAAVLIQADRFGTSIARTLRVFSDGLRSKRRQRAEEAAAKMNVKMIAPLILFIFPAIVVVVGGPALIAIYFRLLPMLSGQ
ncbi:MAG TPA: type II secretion system F family protein [Acidobacteriota bacterium]|nr:type II secretion system F family protein [Acidobacteriota bacterium]